MPESFAIACPSCGGPGRASPEWVGRSVRCRHCKAVFDVPSPGEAEADSYVVIEENPDATRPVAAEAAPDQEASIFTTTYRDPPSRKRPERPKPKRRRQRGAAEVVRDAWAQRRVRLIAGALATALVLVIATFAVPGFATIGGIMLLAIGAVLVGAYYAVGTYAAYREDFLYGFLFLVFPIYTGYYLVTRFDELWPWFAVGTVGFLLSFAGSRALQLSGML